MYEYIKHTHTHTPAAGKKDVPLDFLLVLNMFPPQIDAGALLLVLPARHTPLEPFVPPGILQRATNTSEPTLSSVKGELSYDMYK